MQIISNNYFVDAETPQIPLYLATIAENKVNDVALGCFAMIVHWFLTTFSCFYPAYSHFYETKKAALESDPALDILINPLPKEETLVTFFTHLKNQMREAHIPIQDADLPQNAEAIRNWIKENRELLDQVVALDFSNLGLTSLPSEINMLGNLKTLILRGNPIASLPDGFNPPELEWLYLGGAQIASLPDGFNPPELKRLYLSGTRIASLPDGFNPPKLELLSLVDTPIASLPAGFNPPKLKRLSLEGTPIASLPDGFNPPELEWLYLGGAPIASLPDGFNPPELKTLYLRDAQIASLPDGFNPPELKRLYLSGTRIASLPDGFNPPKLKRLSLEGTPIASLPDGFNPPLLVWTPHLQNLRLAD